MKGTFDDRYPAIFQPGGDGQAVPPAPPALPAQPAAPAQPAIDLNQQPEVGTPVGEGVAAGGAPGHDYAERVPAARTSAAPARWPRRRWVAAVVLAAAMLAVGVFCLTAQYWLPAANTSNPADYHGLILEPWGRVVSQAAPAFLTGGFGIAAALLLMASRQTAATERACRASLWILGALVVAAAFLALFANMFFPEALQPGPAFDEAGPPFAPWPYVVMPSGVPLLTLGLLMVAALVVVPRRWQLDPEDGQRRLAHNGDRVDGGRAVWFGALCLAGGFLAMMAPYLFPLSTASKTVELDNGVTMSVQSWTDQMGILTPPLMLTGVLALAWAAVRFAVTAPTPEPGPDAVEQ